jgi:hypothetical protein
LVAAALREVAIDGRHHAIDALVHRFSAFSEARFGQFCDAVQTDFPDQG